MRRIDVDLARPGELVFPRGFADPSLAKTVDAHEGVPVVTRGAPLNRKVVGGFWIVHVEGQARAAEIAARTTEAVRLPTEVRECMDVAPDSAPEHDGMFTPACSGRSPGCCLFGSGIATGHRSDSARGPVVDVCVFSRCAVVFGGYGRCDVR